MWQGRTLPLDHVGPNQWKGGERRKEREEESRERSSTLSLVFPVIGLLVLVGARRKVPSRSKSFK